jgi:hypothetical protein
MEQRLLLIALVTLTSACATPSFDAPKAESRAFTDTGGTRMGVAAGISEPNTSRPERT